MIEEFHALVRRLYAYLGVLFSIIMLDAVGVFESDPWTRVGVCHKRIASFSLSDEPDHQSDFIYFNR